MTFPSPKQAAPGPGSTIPPNPNPSHKKVGPGAAFYISLPIKLPTLNQYQRLHWSKQRLLRKELGKGTKKHLGELAVALMQQDIQTRHKMIDPPGKRFVKIVLHVKQFQDPDNLVGSVKPLLDAMRDLGLLIDDNRKWLKLRVREKKAKKHKVEIFIWEITSKEGV